MTTDGPWLTPPPRRVPLRVQFACCFGGCGPMVAWCVLLLGAGGLEACIEGAFDPFHLYSFIVMFVMLPIAVIGALLVFASLRDGLRAYKMLRRGRLATGEVVEAKQTGTRFWQLRLAFTDEEGARHEASASLVGHNVEAGETRELLHDPDEPTRVLTVEGYPGDLVLDGEGGFERPSVTDSLLRLVFPVVTGLAVGRLMARLICWAIGVPFE
ncbi:MAG TPA: hypothetical protein QGH10_27155 [Armatimonadota bacterium]|nr:hypothetical protein [Armatimonadota bacterium]